MSDLNNRRSLLIPGFGRIYSRLDASAETLLRVVCGFALAVHGFPKIMNPFGTVGMVEGLGFYPGVIWSPLLATTEFLGGILLLVGFLTRPAALATTIVLLVTVWFHWVVLGEGYSGAEKSILWAAMTFFFVVRGGNVHSVDARIGRSF